MLLGKSQTHAVVIFCKEWCVNKLMSKRPHQIDGQNVDVYRSVPNQGSLKEKKGVKNLTVSDIVKGLVNESHLEQYFSEFGTIKHIDMNCDENSCCIEFDEYVHI
jgi:hypothetical protein